MCERVYLYARLSEGLTGRARKPGSHQRTLMHVAPRSGSQSATAVCLCSLLLVRPLRLRSVLMPRAHVTSVLHGQSPAKQTDMPA